MAAAAGWAGSMASRSQHADLTGNSIAEKTCSSGRSSDTPSTRCRLAAPGTTPIGLTGHHPPSLA